ncbi:MAG: hypothetical protein Ct9H90mP2_10920 [Dehalococcoidia bacterium]|nr:MAG: hypothetical protein Ct9H90mP2_10920 [Dehalococcoidia bacterium]
MITEEIFSSPCKHPNGLQWTEKGVICNGSRTR